MKKNKKLKDITDKDGALEKMRGTTIKGERRSLERHVVINGTHIRIKSVFAGDVPLEKALANIARRRLVTARETKDKNGNS